MSTGKRYAILAGLAVVVTAGGLVAYFSSDSRAREKPAAKGPASVPVSVVAAIQQSVPVRLQAIGNVEAYTSVAVKSRVDGQILEVQFREGQELKKGQVLFKIDPRPFEADSEYCRALGVDAIFAPAANEMYPEEPLTSVRVDQVSSGLCGDYRPGHFEGVATVVAKLFHIVPANRAYFGEKDAQQLAVIQKMAADLNFPIEIVPVATVREPDGLAMSSRNLRLSVEDRKIAPAVYRALQAAAAKLTEGERDAQVIRAAGLDVLREHNVEYLEVVDARTMQPVATIDASVRIVTAVWLGGVRLIDNVLVNTNSAMLL